MISNRKEVLEVPEQLNWNKLKKVEMLWLNNHFCRHGHRYREHLPCFLEEKPQQSPIGGEVVGYLDIETDGLNANFGYVISYCIKVGDKVVGRVLRPDEVRDWKVLDRNLMREFCRDVRRFDRLVVYWGVGSGRRGSRHDLPFLRTRCLKYNLPFPLFGDVMGTDCYDIVRGKLRLHSNRLESVAQFLNIPAKGHKLDPEMWQRAKAGDKKALGFVWAHNCEDCVTLEAVYLKLQEFVRGSRASI